MQSVSLPFGMLEELRAEAQLDAGTLVLNLSGTADLRVAAELARLLQSIHERASAEAVFEVVVDLRGLEFMNSSCFKGVATWISHLQRADASQAYRIRFLSNRGILWQRRSLHALSCLAPELVSVEASPSAHASAG